MWDTAIATFLQLTKLPLKNVSLPMQNQLQLNPPNSYRWGPNKTARFNEIVLLINHKDVLHRFVAMDLRVYRLKK